MFIIYLYLLPSHLSRKEVHHPGLVLPFTNMLTVQKRGNLQYCEKCCRVGLYHGGSLCSSQVAPTSPISPTSAPALQTQNCTSEVVGLPWQVLSRPQYPELLKVDRAKHARIASLVCIFLYVLFQLC